MIQSISLQLLILHVSDFASSCMSLYIPISEFVSTSLILKFASKCASLCFAFPSIKETSDLRRISGIRGRFMRQSSKPEFSWLNRILQYSSSYSLALGHLYFCYFLFWLIKKIFVSGHFQFWPKVTNFFGCIFIWAGHSGSHEVVGQSNM